MIAQTPTDWAVWLAIAVAGTVGCALFCGLETGMYVVNKIRLDLRAEAGNRQAQMLRRMLGQPQSLLAILLIGTNVSTYAVAFAVTEMFDLAGRGDASDWYALAVVTPLLFILGDSVPKNVFRRLAETLTYRMSWLLPVAKAAFTVTGILPFIQGMTWLATRPLQARKQAVEEHLASAFAEGRASGVLTHMQSVMADRVMNIADVTLAQVMVPIGKVASITPRTTREELLRIVQQNNYSRLPVRDDSGAVVGILDIYDILADPNPTAALPAEKMTEPLALPADMTVTEALYLLQRSHKMMAVVTATPAGAAGAAAGGVAVARIPSPSPAAPVGLVTIKDLVEEIVGELAEW
jgi:putative hemolysin